MKVAFKLDIEKINEFGIDAQRMTLKGGMVLAMFTIYPLPAQGFTIIVE